MPDEIYGVMAVKNGQKQTIMNLSNARQKSYADLQTMTDAQKKGVIVCPDYPKEEFLVTADEVSYGGGTVKDALDATDFLSDITTSSGVTLRQDQGYAKIINGVKYIYLRFEISSGFTSRMKIGILPTQGRPSTVIRMTSPCASTYEYPLTMVTTSFITSNGEIHAGDYISPSNTAIKELNIMATYI